MPGPASHPAAAAGPRPSLAQRAFPRRVRAVLEGVLERASEYFDRSLSNALDESEQQLFKLAEQARNNVVQKECLDALREIKRGRADLIPRFLLGLEAELAMLKDPGRRADDAPTVTNFSDLALVDNSELDETVALREIASRAEIRNSLPLFLLGQRFAVVAGRPAFDAESLPVGPHALCRVLREAVACLDLPSEHRQQIFRQFDRQVLQFIGPLYESLNTYFIKQKVLPHLTHVPARVKPVARGNDAAPGGEASSRESSGRNKAANESGARRSAPAATAASGAPGASPTGARAPDSAAARSGGMWAGAAHAPRAAAAAPGAAAAPPAALGGLRPLTAWPGTPDPAHLEAQAEVAAEEPSQSQQDTEMFDVLRQLLAGRRSLLGKLGNGNGAPAGTRSTAPSHIASAEDVQQVLGALQSRPTAPIMVDGNPQSRSVTHLKHDLLAQLRKSAPEGHAPALTEEHGDTIDLVGMLFDHIMKDVRPNSAAASLLTKLQVPLLRVALDDKGFFTRKQHPARQMLNTIAESGAYWTSDDAADRVVVDKMNMLVDRVTREFSGDLTLFDALLGDLSSHMQTQARKAEVAERRHVEAARGKEKLELARLRAAEAIDAKLKDKRVPKFLHSLLAQAWTDVLSLSLLRGGEESEAFRHQLQIAERLIGSAEQRRRTGHGFIAPNEVPALRQEIEEALGQVGYHGNDAQSISTRLLASGVEEEEDDPASRTELAMRLKTRTRLGGGVDTTSPTGEKLAPLSDQEQACLDQIRHLPFGSWFEFKVNQQGEVARRRLSWYSTVTGHCLFVNHRGQRIGEYTLNWMAREMHRGNLKVVAAEQESMIDRAWNAIMGALKSFAGGKPTPAAATT